MPDDRNPFRCFGIDETVLETLETLVKGTVLTKPSPSINVIVLRHLFSCANLKKIKGDKMGQISEQDPGLTIWGILTGFKQSKKDKYLGLNSRDSINIYVSVLFRTWASAICLFLPYLKENGTLTLTVAPYLKEKTTSYLAYDNEPTGIDIQIRKLKMFYDTLNQISKDDRGTHYVGLVSHNIEIWYGPNVYKFRVSIDDAREMTFSYTSPVFRESGDKSYLKETIDDFGIEPLNSTYLHDQILYLDNPPQTNDAIDIDPEKTHIISDITVPQLLKKEHYNDGNIMKFLSWIKSNQGETDTSIFVISHSNVMQDFCTSLSESPTPPQNDWQVYYGSRPGLTTKIIEKIIDNSAWGISFDMDVNHGTESYISSIKMIEGSPKPDPTIPASSCEPGCNYGKESSIGIRLWRRNNEDRQKKCSDIMTGQEVRSSKNIHGSIPSILKVKDMRVNAEEEQEKRVKGRSSFDAVEGGRKKTYNRKTKKSSKSTRKLRR